MADRSHAIRIEGLDELLRTLRRADSDLLKSLAEDHKASAEIVAYEAQTRVPVLWGLLLETIRPGGTQRYGVVRAGKSAVPYAGPIHFGWPARNIAPNTFLYDAADARVDEVTDRFAQSLSRIAASIGD